MKSNRIPKTLQAELEKRRHQIEEYWMEEDGFQPEYGDWSIWIFLTPDFEDGGDPGLGTLHESTARDAINALHRVQPTTVIRW